MRVFNQWTYATRPTLAHDFGVSQTVPDQTLTVRQILERYARGQSITGSDLEPIYLGEDEPPIPHDFSKWAIEDREEYANRHAQRVNEMRTKIIHEQELLRKEQEQKMSKLDTLTKDLQDIKESILKPDKSQE